MTGIEKGDKCTLDCRTIAGLQHDMGFGIGDLGRNSRRQNDPKQNCCDESKDLSPHHLLPQLSGLRPRPPG